MKFEDEIKDERSESTQVRLKFIWVFKKFVKLLF